MAKADPIMACCWLFATVDTKSPRPSVFSRSSIVMRISSTREPRKGTPNQPTAMPVTRKVMISPSRANGDSLPTMSCQGRIGVTMSCSRVPISFSRTIPMEASTMVMIMRIIARTAGT